MITKFNGFEETKVLGEYVQLPKGAYVCKIMGVHTNEKGYGELDLYCDIAEGDYKDYFNKDYENQTGENKKWRCMTLVYLPKDDGSDKDELTKRSFKTFLENVEDSNPGFHFDFGVENNEQQFKGKLIGGLFHNHQWDSKDNDGNQVIHDQTRLKRFVSVEAVRTGKYRMPKDDLVEVSSTSSNKDNEGSLEITADNLPF